MAILIAKLLILRVIQKELAALLENYTYLFLSDTRNFKN
jgi:hypothetical protein